MQAPSELTQLLLQWSEGDQNALDQLFPAVYDELKKLAHARMRNEREGHTLNTTALVHEAYLRMVDLEGVEWTDRAHFYAFSSRVMRHLLVNYAHSRNAQKRGGGLQRIEPQEDRMLPDVEVERFLDLDRTLTLLADAHPRAARAIEYRYFGGLTNDETAAVLRVSHATVERDLRLGRAWLARALS
jgi:RNA polymerase sigma factor (TIGR02999 family)